MGNPFSGGMFGSNPNLSSLAALMAGGNMTNINNMSSLLAGMGSGSSNMSGLINQSSMLQKCEYSSKDKNKLNVTNNESYRNSYNGLDAW